jgi:hypothetical protein
VFAANITHMHNGLVLVDVITAVKVFCLLIVLLIY